MKLTRDTWLAIGLLLILVVIMAFVAIGQEQQGQKLPALTSISSAPNGTLALKLWLQKLNYSVIEETPSTYKIPKSAKIVFVLEPAQITKTELETLDSWVQDGGTLITAGEITFDGLAEHFDFKLDYYDSPPKEFTLQTPLFQNPALGTVIPPSPLNIIASAYLIPGRSSYVTHLAAQGKPVLASFQRGGGRVFIASITYPFTNAGLKETGNPALILNLLGFAKDQGPIWFDEWHHGIRGVEGIEGGGPESWLRYTPLGRSVFFVAVVIFLALLFRGRAFGRAMPLPRELRRRGALEHVSAMANLSRLAGHRIPVLREYHTQLKRSLGRRYRLDPSTPDDAYVAQLTKYNPAINGPALLTLLNKLNQKKVSENELVQIAAEAAKWIKDQ